MKKIQYYLLLGGLTLCQVLVLEMAFGMKDAIAKPPPWAPAHGYRRKQEHEEAEKVVLVPVLKHEEVFRLDPRIQQVWDHLDTNRDGVVSRSEWKESYDLFVRLDQNHDGVLNRPELSRIDQEQGIVSSFINRTQEKLQAFWDWLW